MIAKRLLAVLTAAAIISTMGGCAASSVNTAAEADNNTVEENEKTVEEAGEKGDEALGGEVRYLERKSLINGTNDEEELLNLKPAVPEIVVKDDLSNIINAADYEYYQNSNDDKLVLKVTMWKVVATDVKRKY